MAIHKGQVVKVMEGRGTLMAMVMRVRESHGTKVGFDFSIVEEDGLRGSVFDPSGEIIDAGDVILVKGREYGSEVPAKLLIFRNDLLDNEVGSLIIT